MITDLEKEKTISYEIAELLKENRILKNHMTEQTNVIRDLEEECKSLRDKLRRKEEKPTVDAQSTWEGCDELQPGDKFVLTKVPEKSSFCVGFVSTAIHGTTISNDGYLMVYTKRTKRNRTGEKLNTIATRLYSRSFCWKKVHQDTPESSVFETYAGLSCNREFFDIIEI